MSHASSELPDKIIVDRRKSYRNKDVRQAVRKTRIRLAEQGYTDTGFDDELLALNCRSMLTGTPVVLVLIMLVGFSAMVLGLGARMLLWALVTVFVYAGIALLAREYLKLPERTRKPTRWRRILLVMQVLAGIGWAWFAAASCIECGVPDILYFKASTLLVAMAVTVMFSQHLRMSVIACFLVPVAAFAVTHGALFNTRATFVSAGLVGAMLFFSLMAVRLHRASFSSLGFQSENSYLLAEVETARSISEEARRRAEDANLAKSRFLASMSHELRTPLNAILGFSEVMANEVLGPMENETYKNYARDINQSGAHLLKLINEILDLSRIEAGKQELQEEPLLLGEIVGDCIGLVQMKAGQKNIAIDHVHEKSMPAVFADERSVRQVVLNLLSNAVKFAPSGGKIIVKSGWTASGGQYISVKDNGPGIPEDEIDIVLSAFGQGSVAIKSAEQGTGLGLPIVQALMAMHDGAFKLKSKLREGTEAIAIFPAARVLADAPAGKAPAKRRAPATRQDAPPAVAVG